MSRRALLDPKPMFLVQQPRNSVERARLRCQCALAGAGLLEHLAEETASKSPCATIMNPMSTLVV